MASARLRGLRHRGRRRADAVGVRHRPRHDRLRHRPDVRHALLPARVLHRLGHRGQPRCEPSSSRRRRPGGPRAHAPGVGPGDGVRRGSPQPAAPGAPAAAVYEPEPLPDDTGQYGVYSDHHRSQPEQGPQEQPQPQYAAYEPYAEPAPYGSPGQETYAGPDTYAGQDPLGGQYDYGTDRQQYAAYSDPYIGTGTTGGAPQYDAYDSYGNGYDSFGGRQEYTPDPYAQQYGPDTPPGGVWVPQQREGEQYPVAPPEPPAPPAPYPNGYNNGNGYDEQQYRY